MSHTTALGAFASFLTGLFALGCSESQAPDTGSISVSVVTQGVITDLDANGYTVSIDGGLGQAIGINMTATMRELPVGNHSVRLDDLAPNCSVSGANPRSVDVIASRSTPTPAAVTFSVSCTITNGIFRVSTTTAGIETDADGYSVPIQGNWRAIAPNGTIDIIGLPAGPSDVILLGVAGNCVVEGSSNYIEASSQHLEGSSYQSVTIGPQGTGEHAFVIRCVQSAVLQVTTATTGVEPDPSGYGLSAVPEAPSPSGFSRPLSPNGSATLRPMVPGSHLLTLHGIAPNCDAVMPNPRVVVLTAGQTTAIEVNVTCEAPRELAVVVDATGAANSEIYIVKPGAKGSTQLTFAPRSDADPAWSPDGRRIAFASNRDGNFEIYVMNSDGTSPVRLTNVDGADNGPAWSPDGNRIAFVSTRAGNSEIYVMNSDGTNQVRFTDNATYDADPAWSPDGSKLAFTGGIDGGQIWLMNADGSAPRRLNSVGINEDRQPAWSPDGTRIAFSRRSVSNHVRDIFIVNADGSALTQVTRGFWDSSDPAWSPDGRKIALARTSAEFENAPSVVIVNLFGIEYSYIDSSPGLSLTSGPAWRP